MKKLESKKIRENWVRKKAYYKEDQLLINNFQVMQKWEDNYMKELAKVVTKKGGNILEVGFGLGISASYIQQSKKNKISYHY